VTPIKEMQSTAEHPMMDEIQGSNPRRKEENPTFLAEHYAD
jgi:hypothetical protein